MAHSPARLGLELGPKPCRKKKAPAAARDNPAASGAFHSQFLNHSWPKLRSALLPNVPLDAIEAGSFPANLGIRRSCPNLGPEAGADPLEWAPGRGRWAVHGPIKQSRDPTGKPIAPLNISPHGPRRPQVFWARRVRRGESCGVGVPAIALPFDPVGTQSRLASQAGLGSVSVPPRFEVSVDTSNPRPLPGNPLENELDMQGCAFGCRCFSPLSDCCVGLGKAPCKHGM